MDDNEKKRAVMVANRIGRSLAGGERFPPSGKVLAGSRRGASEKLLNELEEILRDASSGPESTEPFLLTREKSGLRVEKNGAVSIVFIPHNGILALRSTDFWGPKTRVDGLMFNRQDETWVGSSGEPALFALMCALSEHMAQQIDQAARTPSTPAPKWTPRPSGPNPFIRGNRKPRDVP